MKVIRTISKEQAKRFLLLKHGLLGDYKFEGKQGIVEYIRQAGCLQYDPIDVCGKNHELVLFSKIKGFSKGQLYNLLYEDRTLVDGLDKCMAIYLMSDWPYFEHERQRAKYIYPSKEEIDIVSNEILEYIKENGPICSSDIKYDKKVSWYWAPTSLTRAALDRLFFVGDLVLHHKKNTRKYYDLTTRHIDGSLINTSNPNKTKYEILRWSILRRIGGVGMLHNNASYAFMGIHDLSAENRREIYNDLLSEGVINEVVVEGVKSSFYYKAEDKHIMDLSVSNKDFEKRIEFIAPLDNMLWDRKVVNEIFGFDYKWEIYTPQKDRVYGYYVLPILHGADLIGRIELRRNKQVEKITMENIWLENSNKNIMEAVDKKIDEFSCAIY